MHRLAFFGGEPCAIFQKANMNYYYFLGLQAKMCELFSQTSFKAQKKITSGSHVNPTFSPRTLITSNYHHIGWCSLLPIMQWSDVLTDMDSPNELMLCINNENWNACSLLHLSDDPASLTNFLKTHNFTSRLLQWPISAAEVSKTYTNRWDSAQLPINLQNLKILSLTSN